MATINPFTPAKGFTVTAGATTANVNLQDENYNAPQIEITNTSTTIPAVVAFGTSTVTAVVVDGTPTTNRYSIGAGQCKIITRPVGSTYMAYIRHGASDAVLLCATGNGQ